MTKKVRSKAIMQYAQHIWDKLWLAQEDENCTEQECARMFSTAVDLVDRAVRAKHGYIRPKRNGWHALPWSKILQQYGLRGATE